MYVLPLILIVLIALAIFLSPILAVILFVICLIGLGLYKFLGRGADPEHAPPPRESAAASESAATGTESPKEGDAGLWGESWPEQREGAS